MQRGRTGGSSLGGEPWKRLDTVVRWDDLVLPGSTLEQVRAIPAGLSQRFWSASSEEAPASASERRGLLALFAGAGGTGKTMAAQALGRELRLPVVQADIESFYANGRTEANHLIARLFAASERTGAVLVLDHADALLLAARPGSRPLVSGVTAADVRDLLRRCQEYPGIVVFPSTVKHDIDEATLGHFDRVVEFPFPEASARKEIWRRSLGPGARVGGADLAFVAETFQLPGKTIALCARAAASAAAAAGRPVGLEHVATALEKEYSQRLASASTRLALAGLRKRAASPAPPDGAPAPPLRRLEPVPSPDPPPAPRGPEPAPFGTEPIHRPMQPVSSVVPPAPAREYRVVKTELPPPASTREAPAAEAPAADAAPARPPVDLPPRRAAERPSASRATAVSRRRVFAIGVLGALAAVVLGLAVSHHGGSSAAPTLALNRSGSAGPVRFQFPASWRVQAAPSIGGLPLSQAIALSSSAAPSGQVIIGLSKLTSGSPLPQSFVAATVPGTPTPQLVTLGGHHFFRVLDPRLASGSQSETVYALPAADGAVVALCRTASRVFAASCERVLATVRAPAPAPARPGPDPTYAKRLSAVLKGLNAGRASDGKALALARNPAAQAKAAGALATVHSEAAGSVARLSAGAAARANQALAGALRATSSAYRSLSAAAAAGNNKAYRAAQRAVSRANAGITSALAELDALGYRVS
jgi:hypothetical protein